MTIRHPIINQSSVSTKPNYLNLLVEKYGDEFADEEFHPNGTKSFEVNELDSVSVCNSDVDAELRDDGYNSDEKEVLESKLRGRHQNQDASLRIKKLVTILKYRKDLTKL